MKLEFRGRRTAVQTKAKDSAKYVNTILLKMFRLCVQPWSFGSFKIQSSNLAFLRGIFGSFQEPGLQITHQWLLLSLRIVFGGTIGYGIEG
jgi:hypothetical protein